MSQDYGPQITLCRLYERTSKKGTRYLAGKLGNASVAVFKTDDVTDEGQPVWVVKLQEAPRRQDQAPDRQQQTERRVIREPEDQEIPF